MAAVHGFYRHDPGWRAVRATGRRRHRSAYQHHLGRVVGQPIRLALRHNCRVYWLGRGLCGIAGCFRAAMDGHTDRFSGGSRCCVDLSADYGLYFRRRHRRGHGLSQCLSVCNRFQRPAGSDDSGIHKRSAGQNHLIPDRVVGMESLAILFSSSLPSRNPTL